MPKSLLEFAFDFVNESKEPVAFSDMWKYIVEQAGLSEEEAKARIASFYTNLMLDGRFVTLGENQWDLRIRQTFDKVHIDMKDVYSDVEEGDEDSEEEEEEKEYNEAFQEEKESDEEESDEEDEEDSESEEENL
ncbi:MAG: DNA-directed RNA polymerase subunit delta [Bacilli bacterium]|nr:DNA-directed RNA polymerase subunit delta [Bacilli bacterium]